MCFYMCIPKRKIFCFFMVASFFASRADAAWNLPSVRISGGECILRDRRIDETKLMLRFFDFSAQTAQAAHLLQNALGSCGMNVQFVIPSGYRLKTLTHRVQLRAHKGKQTEFAMTAVVEILGRRLSQSGRVPVSAAIDGRLLLYKAHDIESISECASVEQRVEVNADWQLELKSFYDPAPALVDLSGADDGIDLWLEIQRC
ncbi:MAG: hypothetical protein RLZZ488_1285 [Pseudomonadota bacterium]|jgi:hypothetical protein